MAICTSARRIVHIDLQAVTLDDNKGADVGDSTGDDSTVGGTGDTSPGALGSRVTESPGTSP